LKRVKDNGGNMTKTVLHNEDIFNKKTLKFLKTFPLNLKSDSVELTDAEIIQVGYWCQRYSEDKVLRSLYLVEIFIKDEEKKFFLYRRDIESLL
jgi:hypothetical protein